MNEKLKLCRVCDGSVANSAMVCPHCGARLRRGVTFWARLVIGAVLVLPLLKFVGFVLWNLDWAGRY